MGELSGQSTTNRFTPEDGNPSSNSRYTLQVQPEWPSCQNTWFLSHKFCFAEKTPIERDMAKLDISN